MSLIVATIGEKGGGGKSTIATQFVSAYFLKKYEQEKSGSSHITIFEFDAHNISEEDISEDQHVSIEHVENNYDKMMEVFSSIEYESIEKDIIIDVGGSDNTDRFLDLIRGQSIANEIIFVLPEVNKRPRSLENTIKKLKDTIEKPKIIVALNRYSGKMKLEEEFKFFFGDADMSIPPSPFSKDKNICIASIPSCELSLGLANMDKLTLWSMSSSYFAFGHLSRDEKMQAWADENGVCTKEAYIKMTKEVRQSKFAADTINEASSLFDCLDKLSGENK